MTNRHSTPIQISLTLSLLGVFWSTPSISMNKASFHEIEHGQDVTAHRLTLFGNPPEERPPSRTSGGGRGACADQLVALVPGNGDTLVQSEECTTGSSAAIAQTSDAQPTLWFHIPETFAGQEAEFVLLEGLAEPLMEQSIQLPQTSGIIGVPFAEELPLDAQYRWIFTVNVYPDAPADNPVVGGMIERVPFNPDLQRQLEAITPASTNQAEDIAAFYQAHGLWHDVLTQLATPLQSDGLSSVPQADSSPDTSVGWSSLLEQEGLDILKERPVLNCCSLEPVAD